MLIRATSITPVSALLIVAKAMIPMGQRQTGGRQDEPHAPDKRGVSAHLVLAPFAIDLVGHCRHVYGRGRVGVILDQGKIHCPCRHPIIRWTAAYRIKRKSGSGSSVT